MRKFVVAAIVAMTILSAAPAAFAGTNCTGLTINKIWAGDGSVYLYFTNGGQGAMLSGAGGNHQDILALAITAMTGSRSITALYNGNGVNCATARSDLLGIYLN